jgi:hypothetical protein
MRTAFGSNKDDDRAQTKPLTCVLTQVPCRLHLVFRRRDWNARPDFEIKTNEAKTAKQNGRWPEVCGEKYDQNICKSDNSIAGPNLLGRYIAVIRVTLNSLTGATGQDTQISDVHYSTWARRRVAWSQLKSSLKTLPKTLDLRHVARRRKDKPDRWSTTIGRSSHSRVKYEITELAKSSIIWLQVTWISTLPGCEGGSGTWVYARHAGAEAENAKETRTKKVDGNRANNSE